MHKNFNGIRVVTKNIYSSNEKWSCCEERNEFIRGTPSIDGKHPLRRLFWSNDCLKIVLYRYKIIVLKVQVWMKWHDKSYIFFLIWIILRFFIVHERYFPKILLHPHLTFQNHWRTHHCSSNNSRILQIRIEYIQQYSLFTDADIPQ